MLVIPASEFLGDGACVIRRMIGMVNTLLLWAMESLGLRAQGMAIRGQGVVQLPHVA